MPDVDPNLYDSDPLAPDAKERTAALLQLLQQQRTGAMLGAAGGGLNGLLPALGKVMGQQAQTQQTQVQGAPAARLSLIMEKLKQASAQRQEGLANSPAMGAAAQQLLSRFGMTVAPGASPAELQAMLPGAEKAAGLSKFASDMFGRYDVHTGKSVPGTGPVENLISPQAIDQAAKAYLQQGPAALPSFGRANPVVHGLIVKRAAELDPNANLTGNKASSKADSGSLASQQKILDNAEGWERTGDANLAVLLNISKKLANTGSPWINAPVRRFLEKGTGDPDMPAFRAAHATVVNEYAKILSGAQGSGAVTEGARHEAESMLPLDATPEQLMSAAQVLRTDAGNRINSARQQVASIKGRLGGGAAPSAAAPAAAPAQTYDKAAIQKKYGLGP